MSCFQQEEMASNVNSSDSDDVDSKMDAKVLALLVHVTDNIKLVRDPRSRPHPGVAAVPVQPRQDPVENFALSLAL